jgi:hypothetical protein
MGKSLKATPEEERDIRELIMQAVKEEHGSITDPTGIKNGFRKLLRSPNHNILKFAWSHVIGVPVDRKYLELSGPGGGPIETFDYSKLSEEQMIKIISILSDEEEPKPTV